jgi:DNA-binding NarL/FixJ family response regulator
MVVFTQEDGTTMQPVHASTNAQTSQDIHSLYGPLVPMWLPSALGFDDPQEVGKALIARRYQLSYEEVETLALVAQGYTNGALAEKLGLYQEKSVKNRVKAILEKLDVTNRTEAAAIAARYGLGPARFRQA